MLSCNSAINRGLFMRSALLLLFLSGVLVAVPFAHAQEAGSKKEAKRESLALKEVNAARTARGLPPYVEDPLLTEAARAAATFRAERLIEGHTWNDFAFIPAGGFAAAAGCAAWQPEWGWGSCCTFERWRYAGAAWDTGRDGRRYMHLFVR